jgi:hypothetical protein
LGSERVNRLTAADKTATTQRRSLSLAITVQSAEGLKLPEKSMRHYNVTGFLYSGKSAVLDFLSGYTAAVHFPGGEVRFNEFMGGEQYLLEKARKQGGLQEVDLQAFAALMLASARDNPQIFTKSLMAEYFDHSASAIMKYYGSSYKDLIGRYLDYLQSPSSSNHLSDSIRQVFAGLTRFFQNGLFRNPAHEIALYNNCVRPWQLFEATCARMFDHIVVQRDWRDQYVELKTIDKHVKFDAQQFCHRQKTNIGSIRNLPLISNEVGFDVYEFYGNKVFLVKFEDFVLNEDVRRSVSQELGLDYAKWSGERRWTAMRVFSSAESQKNIGIYKDADPSIFSEDLKFISNEMLST